MPDCPATIPCGPGTTPLSRAHFSVALSPATAPAPAGTIHRAPWPVSRASSGTSLLAADQMPLHHTAMHPAIHHCLRPTRRLFTTQLAVHPAVHHRSWPTGCLFTAQQLCSPPAANTAGEGPVTYTS